MRSTTHLFLSSIILKTTLLLSHSSRNTASLLAACHWILVSFISPACRDFTFSRPWSALMMVYQRINILQDSPQVISMSYSNPRMIHNSEIVVLEVNPPTCDWRLNIFFVGGRTNYVAICHNIKFDSQRIHTKYFKSGNTDNVSKSFCSLRLVLRLQYAIILF